MGENKTNLGDFFCTVSSNGQIFIPVRMSKALGINPGDIVKFSVQKDNVLFSKDDPASKDEKNAPAKTKEDTKKRTEALK